MSGAIWSTRDGGAMCPKCHKVLAHCICKQMERAPVDGIVRIQRETKGRKGSGVTLVVGVPLVGKELTELAKQLKKRCGSGGTVKDGVIEVQGDHRETILAALEKRGFQVKLAGG